MQPVRLCIYSSRRFEETFENTQWRKDKQNATSVNMHALVQVHWGHTWKRTPEKGQINATSATLHLFMQAIWGDIWKHTAEKGQTNATNATMHPLRQAIWGDIWKHTAEKGWTNAMNEITQPAQTWYLSFFWDFGRQIYTKKRVNYDNRILWQNSINRDLLDKANNKCV